MALWSLQMASTVPSASDCCLYTSAFSENKCGAFFNVCTLQELQHWQDDKSIQHTEDSNLFHPTLAGENVFFPFRRVLENYGNGCS